MQKFSRSAAARLFRNMGVTFMLAISVACGGGGGGGSGGTSPTPGSAAININGYVVGENADSASGCGRRVEHGLPGAPPDSLDS